MNKLSSILRNTALNFDPTLFEEAKKNASKTKWVKPSISEEIEELERTAEEEGIALEVLLQACETAKLVTLTDDVWSQLDNSWSWETETIELAIEYADEIGRDTTRILRGVGGTLPAPMVLFREGHNPYLIGGNTRLSVFRALNATPKVLAVHI
ncbi:MAG: hypothetical protein UY48_C0006G0055 [Candidatus Gottesmanbacteria bacterium GW2011_GWB1_49_7]|uniref:ParB/Sulfiredoxin domain-containing protein n=1 Tax=Candidatus Gottesmanbacteria bacterium GW2011_GWB1_49_7 TaxID=1618448 RepID=A0A0G1YDE7_9BACT|nr:MAG: hypothetical protein UY48_C0006G0055 [Candidatus Gottesmanbacteria bacterium GW2011_GWB1_49_7]